jgi:hypothetical protein
MKNQVKELLQKFLFDLSLYLLIEVLLASCIDIVVLNSSLPLIPGQGIMAQMSCLKVWD